MKVSMLLLAAGRGMRLGGDRPKAFVDCAGKSLVLRSVERLRQIDAEGEILVTVGEADRAPYAEPAWPALEAAGATHLVTGGATRQESMARAIAASDPSFGLVLVHDAARPFFPVEAAREALRRAEAVGAAFLAIPTPDTLKRVDESGRVVETLDRSAVWQAQTPQVAQRDLFVAALERAARDGFAGTDDMSLLEHAGTPVEVVRGSPTNIKVTHADDLVLAGALARREAP